VRSQSLTVESDRV